MFNRGVTGSKKEHAMSKRYRLNSTIGPSYNVKDDDVLAIKTALDNIGYYKKPDWGITAVPDVDLFSGIEKFQADNGLKKDGVIKPGGPTEIELAARSPSYKCPKCGAFHGGVAGRLCPECDKKAQ